MRDNLSNRLRQADFDAFSELITKYRNQIYNLAKRMTGNLQDAEDILQETMLKAVDNIDKFRGDSSFGTWLYSIALNAGRAFMAKEKRKDLKPIEEYLPSGGHSHPNTPSELFEWRDPHSLMENSEIRKLLDEAMDAMRSEYSIPFILRYMEDLPVKEVAKVMKLSLPATKSRILRARLFLREKIETAMKEKINV